MADGKSYYLTKSSFVSDLRGDRSLRAERCVSFEEGKKMAASVKCCRYLETSALHAEGLTGMFELAVSTRYLFLFRG